MGFSYPFIMKKHKFKLTFISCVGLFFLSFCRLAFAQTPVPVKAESGVSEHEIRIGQTTNLQLARPKSLFLGAQLFFTKLNSSGGVHGRKIKIIMLDDGYVPKNAHDNVKTLIENENIFALFQIFGTNPVAASLPLIEQANIPLVAPGTGYESLREPIHKNVFNVTTSYLTEAKGLVEFLIHDKNVEDICTFNQDDALGAEGSGNTAKALSKIGKKLKMGGTYKRQTEEISEAFNYLKKADCKAVILWSQTKPTLAFLKLAKEQHFDPIFVAASPLSGSEFYNEASKLSDNLFMSTTVPLPNDKSDPFMSKYLSDCGAQALRNDPSFFEGYLEAAILTQAIRLAGKQPTRELLREAFEEKMQNAKFGKINVQYNKQNHRGLNQSFIVKVKKESLEIVK
jgi:branched-chain amino acid transport system substrate-binding protein